MPQPTPYDRDFSFTDYQASTPSSPLPGPKVDAELDHLADTLKGVLGNLALIQRDDGALKNAIVGIDAMSDNVLFAIAAAIVLHTKGQDALPPAFTFSVNTLAPGAPATVGVSGSYPNLQIAFGIPKGDPSIGGATLEDGDYGDVLVSAGGSAMAVQTVNGEDPYRAGHQPAIADVVGLAAALAGMAAPNWAAITGVPASFPPDAHDHNALYYTKAEVDTALAAKANTGAFATVAAVNAKADSITTIKSFNSSQTVSDAAHNGCYNKMTGSATRTITFGSVPDDGHCSIWVNRGTVAMTVACPGGYWKNGAAGQATTNFSLAVGEKLTAFHEGGGDWSFEIV